ncbi:hypothetical protein EJ04DRAFT_175790 [Polyplosphaeria fusca]|uniref:Uncharacterized protein n=1 Tax=Polyplosphaeria fusca TaxID=682080 RepID=A0A9P4V498_9PLEO|nr:hypothetical protein EJ04DRAFT_175790 [Polyplosphaeria fusca]
MFHADLIPKQPRAGVGAGWRWKHNGTVGARAMAQSVSSDWRCAGEEMLCRLCGLRHRKLGRQARTEKAVSRADSDPTPPPGISLCWARLGRHVIAAAAAATATAANHRPGPRAGFIIYNKSVLHHSASIASIAFHRSTFYTLPESRKFDLAALFFCPGLGTVPLAQGPRRCRVIPKISASPNCNPAPLASSSFHSVIL